MSSTIWNAIPRLIPTSPTHPPAVVDIVVNQRRGMDQLERRSQVDGLTDVLPAQRSEGEQSDHRSNSLATGLDHVAGDVVKQGFFGDDAFPDSGFDQGQFISHTKVERTHDRGPSHRELLPGLI